MKELLAWFTPAKRKAIYGVVAAASTLLVVVGVISEDQLNQFVVAGGQVIAALSTLLALVNVPPVE